jgi:protein-tyrosine phosphatase
VIDLHSHILPGLDDGAATLEDALAMARAAVANGTQTIVATPQADLHYDVRPSARDAALATLRVALTREAIPLEVLPGAEVAIDVLIDLDDEARDALRLGGGPYLLLESPLAQTAGAFDTYIERLLMGGERIVLAHPERCPAFQRKPERLERLVRAGALTSVTAGAFTGQFGATVQKFAFSMVTSGWAHSVASDCHDAVRRSPSMGHELDQSGLGAVRHWLTHDVPAAILAGSVIPRAPVELETALERPRRRMRLFRR